MNPDELTKMNKKIMGPPFTALIVLVDRGDCTFVTKVRAAQNAGAAAVIVADNHPEFRNHLPYMADDKTGGSINIQSILIDYADGLVLKSSLKESNEGEHATILVKLSWNLPHPDGRVEYDLFTTSEVGVDNFKFEFAPVAEVLGDAVLFTPHYELMDGDLLRCTEKNGRGRYKCGNQCTNQGRYCHYDPEQLLNEGFTGAQIVRENIRQKCLANYVNETKQHQKWWEYATKFEKKCGVSNITFTEECSYGLMEEIIDGGSAPVKACIKVNGGYGDEDQINKLVEDELKLIVDISIFSWPTLLINKRPFRNALTCATKPGTNFDATKCGPLQAICTGYAQNTLPDACKSTRDCPLGEISDECGVCGGTCFGGCKVDKCNICMLSNSTDWNKGCMGCDNVPSLTAKKVIDVCDVCDGPGRDICGNCPTEGVSAPNDESECSGGGGFPVWGVALIVIGCVFVVGGGVFFYMRRREDAMRQDIDSLLKQYLPMGDQSMTAEE